MDTHCEVGVLKKTTWAIGPSESITPSRGLGQLQDENHIHKTANNHTIGKHILQLHSLAVYSTAVRITGVLTQLQLYLTVLRGVLALLLPYFLRLPSRWSQCRSPCLATTRVGRGLRIHACVKSVRNIAHSLFSFAVFNSQEQKLLK